MSTRLDHINMTVLNLDDSIRWYEKLFGFSQVEGGVNQYGRRWAIIAIDDSMLAMTEFVDKDTRQMTAATEHQKIYHFGLRIDDVQKWREKIKEHGVKIHYGGEVEYPHSRSWYIHDPSGHEIEVSFANGRPLRFG